MPIPIVLGVIAGLSALYSVYRGVKQTSDAKKRASKNKRPDFDVQQEYFDNQTIAESQAGQGYTSKTVDNFRSASERGLQASIDAQLRAGGGPNAIQGSFANYNLSNRNFAAADAEKHTENIQLLYARNKDLAAQKVQGWVINDYQKFKDEAAAISQERAAGEQNIKTGISEGVAVVAGLSSSQANASLFGGAVGKGKAGRQSARALRREGLNSGNMGDAEGGDVEEDGSFSSQSGTVGGGMFSDYYSFLKDQEQSKALANAVSTASGVEGGLTPQQISAIEKIVSGKYNFKDEENPSPF